MMSWNARLHLVLCLEGISFLKIEHPISSLRILFQATEKWAGGGVYFKEETQCFPGRKATAASQLVVKWRH